MNSIVQQFDQSSNELLSARPAAGLSAQSPTTAQSARRYDPQSALLLVAGAVGGAASAVLIVALASLLPTGQTLNALAALAAGVAVPLLWLSLDDTLTPRALFRAAVAVASAAVAYQALAWGAPMLGLAYVLALAWVVMDWIDAGASPVRLALTTALATLAGLSASMV